MAQFFIGRPIFAWVIAIITMLAGALALRGLPIEQYPQIAPPTITVSATYPGASAQAVEDAVTQVVEQQMSGLDGLRYISANSSSNGSMSMTLTFESGTDPDIAQVQVQNRLARATPLLPEEVQRQGVIVAKAREGFLMILALTSDDPTVTSIDLADAMASQLQDPVARVDGVGGTVLLGAPYAMRIWLDPHKLAGYGLSAQDVVTSIRSQNVQVTGGQIGGGPAVEGQQITSSITVQSLMETPEEFRAIPIRTLESGGQLTIGDVARVEIGASNYGVMPSFNGQNVTGLGINLATGANALDTAEHVRSRAQELAAFLPAGYNLDVAVDSSPYIEESIDGVVHTLMEAALFVFIIMFLFLQNVRATLIVMITVPVVLLGTFGVMAVTGLTINTLTMLALVLAIGLLIDDAIVVIENVERIMEEEGLGPLAATRKAMGQITSALVGIGAVLSAVFIPMAFFGGTAGVIYRQFALTIVTAMALSVIFAIVLTPALCATLLKPMEERRSPAPGSLAHRLATPLRWFDGAMKGFGRFHANGTQSILGRGSRVFLLYVGLTAVTVFAFTRIESAFLPDEDQGVMYVLVTMPPGTSQERTRDVMDQVNDYLLTEEEGLINRVFSVAGFSFIGSGSNVGTAFVRTVPWDERTGPGESVQAIAGRSMAALNQIKDARVFVLTPPAVPSLGTSNGFSLFLQDRGGQGHDALIAARNQLLGMAAQNPKLVGVRPNGLGDEPQIQVDIDYQAALAAGLTANAVNATLSTALGGVYVNDFIDRGRIKRVYVAAEAQFSESPEDILLWRVPNANGDLVPFSAFADIRWSYGSPKLERYNGVPSISIAGSAAPGVSSGAAIEEIEKLATQLPPGFGIAWTGLSLEEQETSGQAPLLFALSILVVFLCLAALYESWSVPLSVIMVVPLGVLGAVGAVYLAGLSNDIFLQVGLLAVVGLSAKNAILIVEFAKELEESGRTAAAAALEAAKVRLRPILMTSFAFGLGVLPLALATGAGAAGRSAIGIAVLGGTIAASALGVFLTPLFYVLVRRLFGGKQESAGAPADAALSPAE